MATHKHISGSGTQQMAEALMGSGGMPSADSLNNIVNDLEDAKRKEARG